MRYLAELYYFAQADFPVRKAVLVTATTVAHDCRYFYARILAPCLKSTAANTRSGLLPADPAEKEAFVAGLVGWLFAHSLSDNLFCLLLDENPLPRRDSIPRFAHYDITDSWVLDLSPTTFAALQERWQAEGLPADLFYPETETRCVPYPGKGLVSTLWRRLGVQKCYTPKQWEAERNAISRFHRTAMVG